MSGGDFEEVLVSIREEICWGASVAGAGLHHAVLAQNDAALGARIGRQLYNLCCALRLARRVKSGVFPWDCDFPIDTVVVYLKSARRQVARAKGLAEMLASGRWLRAHHIRRDLVSKLARAVVVLRRVERCLS